MLKKWWVWIAGIIVILLVWQGFSGWAMSRKLYTMALDNLRKDQTTIVEQQKQDIETFKQKVSDLQKEVIQVQKEKSVYKSQAIASANEVIQLKGKVNDLQNQIDNIRISDNPDSILLDLQRQGIRIRRRVDTR